MSVRFRAIVRSVNLHNCCSNLLENIEAISKFDQLLAFVERLLFAQFSKSMDGQPLAKCNKRRH